MEALTDKQREAMERCPAEPIAAVQFWLKRTRDQLPLAQIGDRRFAWSLAQARFRARDLTAEDRSRIAVVLLKQTPGGKEIRSAIRILEQPKRAKELADGHRGPMHVPSREKQEAAFARCPATSRAAMIYWLKRVRMQLRLRASGIYHCHRWGLAQARGCLDDLAPEDRAIAAPVFLAPHEEPTAQQVHEAITALGKRERDAAKAERPWGGMVGSEASR